MSFALTPNEEVLVGQPAQVFQPAQYHRSRKGQAMFARIKRNSLILLVCIAAVVGGGVFKNPTTTAAGLGFGVVAFIFIILTVLGWVIGAALSMANKQMVILGPQGLLIAQSNHREMRRWSDLNAVYLASVNTEGVDLNLVARTSRYIVKWADGTKHVFDDSLDNFAVLGRALETQQITVLLPGALAKVESGQPVTIGNVTISKDGLQYQQRLLAWGEVASPNLAFGKLCLRQRNTNQPWAKLSLTATPNLGLLLTLIDEGIQRYGPKSVF